MFSGVKQHDKENQNHYWRHRLKRDSRLDRRGSDFRKAVRMNNERISLADRLQHQWFLAAMRTLTENRNQLNKYDRELWQKLSDGYDLVGQSMSITRKQMNHIQQVAAELKKSGYYS